MDGHQHFADYEKPGWGVIHFNPITLRFLSGYLGWGSTRVLVFFPSPFLLVVSPLECFLFLGAASADDLRGLLVAAAALNPAPMTSEPVHKPAGLWVSLSHQLTESTKNQPLGF